MEKDTGDEEIITPEAYGMVKGDLGMETTIRQFCVTSGAVKSAGPGEVNLFVVGGGHGNGGVGGSRSDGESRAKGEYTRERVGTFVRPLLIRASIWCTALCRLTSPSRAIAVGKVS